MFSLRQNLRDRLQGLRELTRAAYRRHLYRRRIKSNTAYTDWIRSAETKPLSAKAKPTIQHTRWISLVLPVSDSDTQGQLEATLRCILAQVSSNWELLIAPTDNVHSTIVTWLERARKDHASIHLLAPKPDINQAAQQALTNARAPWVALMRAGDQWRSDTTEALQRHASDNPDAAVLYPDNDSITQDGKRSAPQFKPDWNPELFVSTNYVGRHYAADRALLHKSGGYLYPTSDEAFVFAATIRLTHGLTRKEITHIPEVLIHEGPIAERVTEAHVDVLKRWRESTQMESKVTLDPLGVIWESRAIPKPLPKVSIIICTKDQSVLLNICIESILRKTNYPDFEILIVDNGSVEQRTFDYLHKASQDPRIEVIRNDAPFNFSALNNEAARISRGSILALVNNDIEVISEGWLTELVSHACRPDVGCVGAKLLYPDDTIQHAGILIGGGQASDGRAIATHYFRGLDRNLPGYANRAIATMEVSAVTGACLAVRKEVFWAISGLDEENLAVAYNDVDFCLRVSRLGLRHIYAPHALLYHHESITRGTDKSKKDAARFSKELSYMRSNWDAALGSDPMYNKNLCNRRGDFALPRA